MKIPVLELKPAYLELRAEFDAAYHRVMESGRYLLGPELDAFEGEFARSVGAAHCVGVANGLEALQLALMTQGIGPGDEVIVPAHGYIATWLAVSHVGARPVPCECDPATYTLDLSAVKAALTARTKALLPIHLYGLPADMEGLRALSAPRGLFLLEDAAQAHGARLGEARVGNLGDAAAFSFYPSKNLGAFADAGAVTTNNPGLAERLRTLRNYGSRTRYEHVEQGLNSRLGELQAAFLRVRLSRLADWNARRRALAARYQAGLEGIEGLSLPSEPAGLHHVWHLYVVRTHRREALRAALAERGIETQIHYPTPPHRSPAYRALGFKEGAFPVAERLANEVLSLPLGPHLAAEQVDSVVEAVRSFFQTT